MPNSRKLALLALILVVATAGLYWQTTRQDFCVFDDDDYVLDNPWVNEGMSWDAARWAFTTYHAANWHPLTWLSHQADCSLFELYAGGHHLTNLLLHATNTLLLFLLLRSLTGKTGRAWIVAAFFGWHPLRVESVAWISERKDLLSTFFLLGSIWAYCRFARKMETRQSEPEQRTQAFKYFYCLALFLFAAGLMSKPMVVTLPCLLLLLDYWPLQRTPLSPTRETGRSWAQLLAEKIPFFVLSAAGCLLTVAAQHAGGAIKSTVQVPLALRALNALSAYGEYLIQTIWPSPLCIFYPLPAHYPISTAMLGAALLVGLTCLTMRLRRSCPWLITGWLWFIGSLVPVIGLVQVGAQAHADRYTYIPSIGLYIGVVWAISHLVNSPRAGKIAAVSTSIGLAACLLLTSHQIGYWQDSATLYAHALANTPNNAPSQLNLGVGLARLGRSKEAIVHYREAIRLEPTQPRSHYDLGIELVKQGDLDGARDAFTSGLKYDPHSDKLLNNLGVVLAQQGKYEEALNYFEQAMHWNPIYPSSYLNAGVAFQAMGQPGPAVTNYSLALRLEPNSAEILRHLAYLFATCPDQAFYHPSQAVQLAGRAAELTQYQAALYLQTLAIAYAAEGQYANAIAASEKALQIAKEHGSSELVSVLQAELESYHAGKNPKWDWKHSH